MTIDWEWIKGPWKLQLFHGKQRPCTYTFDVRLCSKILFKIRSTSITANMALKTRECLNVWISLDFW